jgi:hypothetical protein
MLDRHLLGPIAAVPIVLAFVLAQLANRQIRTAAPAAAVASHSTTGDEIERVRFRAVTSIYGLI